VLENWLLICDSVMNYFRNVLTTLATSFFVVVGSNICQFILSISCSCKSNIYTPVFVSPQGSPLSLRVYKRYPEGLGEALYRELFDFNAEPPWDPS